MHSTLDTMIDYGTPPNDEETLEDYLGRMDLLGRGFAYKELVRGGAWNRRHREPKRNMWLDFALVLAAAIEFRERAIVEAGVTGLRVAAAYRPSGGAARSAHKFGRALDLDRLGGDPEEYFRCAVRFWSERGPELDMGLGLYTGRASARGGIRVHIDVNHGLRSWQGIGKGFGKPYRVDGSRVGLPRQLAWEMGLGG